MNDLATALCDWLKQREADTGATLIWAGDEYPCSGGAELGGKMLGAGGFRTTAQVTLVLRIAELEEGSARPQEHQSVSYKSTSDATARPLRIAAVNTLFGAALILECNDPNQGA